MFWSNLEATLKLDSLKDIFGFVQKFFPYKCFNEKWKISICCGVLFGIAFADSFVLYLWSLDTMVSKMPYRCSELVARGKNGEYAQIHYCLIYNLRGF